MSGVSRIGLGAALFGGRESAADPRRRLSAAEVFATVALAADAGVRLVDTAAEWSGSEAALGSALPRRPPLRVVTKTARLSGGLDAVERRARASLRNLQQGQAHAILVHRAADLLAPEGAALWDRLKRLKDEGLYENIGIAACVCDDPVGLARRFKPDLMQLPASLMDQRLVISGALDTIAAMGIEIQLRSVFLRGLLFKPGHDLPDGLSALAPNLSRVRRAIAEAGADPLQAALAFALGRPEASAVIVGVSAPGELRAILAAAAVPAPQMDWAALAGEQPCLLQARRRCAAA